MKEQKKKKKKEQKKKPAHEVIVSEIKICYGVESQYATTCLQVLCGILYKMVIPELSWVVKKLTDLLVAKDADKSHTDILRSAIYFLQGNKEKPKEKPKK